MNGDKNEDKRGKKMRGTEEKVKIRRVGRRRGRKRRRRRRRK
jgi:hypothetical protein